MPASTPSLLAVALAVVAATVLVACGGEDAQLLPGGTAREITANLDTVKQLADEGDCIGAESAARQVSEQVDALGGVDRRLKGALREGAKRLNEVVASCEEEPEEAISPAEIPSEVEPEDEEEPPGRSRDEKEKPKDEATTSPAEPPASPGSPPAAGEGDETPPPAEGGAEDPSGGISPGSPAGEGE